MIVTGDPIEPSELVGMAFEPIRWTWVFDGESHSWIRELQEVRVLSFSLVREEKDGT